MNQVRITSGIYRSRKIETPGGKTHPMGERERLALFNMIAEFIPNSMVLDAFSGSGALGIEAFSRGASNVVFIEKDRKAESVIRKNLDVLGLSPTSVCMDVKKYETDEKFDVILADPPYDAFDIETVKHLIKFLAISGVFVLSHPGKAPVLADLCLNKTKSYAGANISIYTREK